MEYQKSDEDSGRTVRMKQCKDSKWRHFPYGFLGRKMQLNGDDSLAFSSLKEPKYGWLCKLVDLQAVVGECDREFVAFAFWFNS